MNIKFLLSFNTKKADFAKSKIRIFYSLRKHSESRAVISSFMEELKESFSQFEWKLSGFSDFLFNLKYLGVYLSAQPTIFMEINNLQLEEQEVVQDLIAKVLIKLKGDSVPSLKNKVPSIKKPRLSSAKTRKKHKKKSNPLLPPPEGPVFQFVPLAEGERVSSLLPPQQQGEKVESCAGKQNKVEVNLLEEVKKWSQSD